MQWKNSMEIRGKHSEVAKLIGKIERNQSITDWKRDLDAEEKLNANIEAPTPGVFCVDLEDGPLTPVKLILKRIGWDELFASSIITKDRKPLSDIEYNRILGDFHANVLVPIAVGIKVVLEMSPLRLAMEEFLSPSATERLKEFSLASNQQTGHVLDWSKWNRFVIQAHLDSTYLDDVDLNSG